MNETRQAVPPVKFCWECGRKLYGRHHVLATIEGHPKTLHKQCYDNIVREGILEVSEITRN